MKRIVLFLLIVVIAITCKRNDENIPACGFDNPTEQITWLKELIEIADSDTTGLYKGKIYLEEYNGNDVFWVEMSMGSGALMGHWFDCDGNTLIIPIDSITPSRQKLIYANIP